MLLLNACNAQLALIALLLQPHQQEYVKLDTIALLALLLQILTLVLKDGTLHQQQLV